MVPQLNAEPQGVETYFTGVEQLQQVFKNAIAAHMLAKRLLIIHGIGGVGKSSLLRMFRLHCKNVAHVPVALASGDDAKSAVDVLIDWANDMKIDGVAPSTFFKAFEHYRVIQAQAEDKAGKFAEKVARGTVKTIIETATSTIPGIGRILGKLGGIGADALIDWLRGQGFSKPDIDLLLDPARKMTDDFLADVAKIAPTKRLVLMLDTYEQMSALDDWTRDLAQRLHPNVLLVIAGREMVNWDRQWRGWLAQADVHPLEAMTPEVMRELVRNYYRTQVGGDLDPAQVEKIIRFSRGLPMAVTTAVRLWVKYRVKDFEEVEAGALDELVRRLREGVPPQIIPILEAAAAVRYFNKEILRVVSSQDDVNAAYDELRRFPFAKSSKEGPQRIWRLHDSVREFIDRSLQVDDPERFRELHERAASYFEKRLEKPTSEEIERLGLERLYHLIRADEEAGIKLFQEMAEKLSRFELVIGLQILLNDLDNYQLGQQSSNHWRDYYRLRLKMLRGERKSLADSYRILSKKIEQPKLLAYALCDLGEILIDRDTVRNTSEEAKEVLERALSVMPNVDSKIISVYIHLRGYYLFHGQWDESMAIVQKRLQLSEETHDEWGVTRALRDEAFAYGWMGDWRNAINFNNQVRQRLVLPTSSESMKADVRLRPWYLVWSGRYKEAEIGLREAIEIDSQIGHSDPIWPAKRDLAFSLALQDRFEYGHVTFHELLSHFEELEKKGEWGSLLGFWGFSRAREGDFVQAMNLLVKSWKIKQELEDVLGYQETLFWLGYVAELLSSINSTGVNKAAEYYLQAYSNKKYGRCHFECAALTGLVRVKHAQADYAAIPPLLAEAEQLAHNYEYNDHLASLRLTQGMTTDKIETNGQTTALDYFKQAMIYALRYNRFLLDEVLSGRPQGTPLRPIIPYCLDRGEEGRKILIVLRDWWKTGINDIGTPRPDTISPIPEGIALLEAERISREREPGNGSLQKTVIEQIEMALK